MRALLFALAAFPLLAQYDVLIRNAKVVDGSGSPWFRGDIAIQGDRIARMAPAGVLRRATAAQVIEAGGLVAAPGFIDIQAQSGDALLDGDGRLVSKITQGITSEILGEGESGGPVNERMLSLYRKLGLDIPRQVADFTGPHGFDGWLKAMERHGGSPNFGSFLGSGTLRTLIKGMDEGEASAAELEEMRTYMRQAMEDGAFGLASALIYPPNSYSSTAELIETAKAMAPYGGVYITHMRSEGDGLLEAIDEAIAIGRQGGVPVEIYHLKAGGKRNWPKMAQAIAKIDQARRQGLDIGADMYAYTAGATGLSACLPPSASEGGKLFDRLADAKQRAAIKAEALRDGAAWEQMCKLAGPENVLLVGFKKPENRKYAGQRLSEVAAAEGKDYLDAAMDLILRDGTRVETVFFMMDEENVKMQLRQPWMKFGTDAGGVNPEKPEGLVHPRSYGNYPRVFGKYVREEKVLSLEDAVRKSSGAVAARLSLHDRGLLKTGLFADVVLFDENTIGDRATYESPHQLSTGVRWVFVNGVAVLREGVPTGAKPGRILRGPGYRLL